MPTIYNVFRALVGIESGRFCRSCAEPVHRHDHFGMSEGVCRACRA
jgi:hypothetical protein